ncbi:type II secretion system F family protein [Brachybacterium sp. EF45031]|nr:type II secretion system F family protein [Brachybacterium sillae]
MAGAALGLMLGIGLFCLWWSAWEREPGARREGHVPALLQNLADDLRTVGLSTVSPMALLGLSAGISLVVLAGVHAFSRALVPSVTLAVICLPLPILVVRGAARRRRVSLREVWPEVVDHMNSAVRAGLSLPEALVQVGQKGPEELRDPFLEFGRDYQVSGDFGSSLDRLKDRLADPVGDRVVEALRVTRDVGGTDLGRLLRTLAAFLREDARTRAELEARQSWTVNASRLALAAPWLVLALMATRPEAAQAYDTAAGAAVIVGGGVVSLVAYRVMRMISRLPQDERVLR